MTHLFPEQQDCSNCRYWRENVSEIDSGNCCRHPPIPCPGLGATAYAWPITESGDWCGEWCL